MNDCDASTGPYGTGPDIDLYYLPRAEVVEGVYRPHLAGGARGRPSRHTNQRDRKHLGRGTRHLLTDASPCPADGRASERPKGPKGNRAAPDGPQGGPAPAKARSP
ncbi:unnamed protein product [Boreogadus saida]